MGAYSDEIEAQILATSKRWSSRLRRRLDPRRVLDRVRRTSDDPIERMERTSLRRSILDCRRCRYQVPERSRPLVLHVIGSLGAGGAERQMLQVARESIRRGLVEARVIVLTAMEGEFAHYLPVARQAGVDVEQSGRSTDPFALLALRRDGRLSKLLQNLPPAYRAWCADLAGEILRLRPDVVHAWLDQANIFAGIASLANGVPSVVLSTRNVNPTHFPGLGEAPYFLPWYRRLSRSPRVRWIANSRIGADGYASWIGMDAARFHVIQNGVDPEATRRPSEERLEELRRSLAPPGARFIAGVFRIAEEKQPLVFANAARRIVEATSDVHVLVLGVGPLESELRAAIRGHEDRIHLLGRRGDVTAVLSISELLLHASRQEGSPNAILEAQAIGCPVVATRSGGTCEVVEEGVTALLADVGDAESLASASLRILGDPILRQSLGAKGRDRVSRHHSVEELLRRTVAVYREGSGGRNLIEDPGG